MEERSEGRREGRRGGGRGGEPSGTLQKPESPTGEPVGLQLIWLHQDFCPKLSSPAIDLLLWLKLEVSTAGTRPTGTGFRHDTHPTHSGSPPLRGHSPVNVRGCSQCLSHPPVTQKRPCRTLRHLLTLGTLPWVSVVQAQPSEPGRMGSLA